MIFEEEEEGLEGEPARARVFLKLAGLYGVVALVCIFLVDVAPRKGYVHVLALMFGAICSLGAIYGTARALFHSFKHLYFLQNALHHCLEPFHTFPFFSGGPPL